MFTMTSAIAKAVQKGKGMTIAGDRELERRITSSEAEGGLPDGMEGRDLLITTLKRLIASLTEARLREEIHFVFIQFRRGNSSLFDKAIVMASKLPLAQLQGSSNFDVFPLGQVKRNLIGGGYHFLTPTTKALINVGAARDIADKLQAADNERMKGNFFSDKDRMLADQISAANRD